MLTESFITNNFPKGKLTLIGGRPAMGKTSFAISLAISLARQNIKCIYFSCEINREQLVRRIKLQTGISGYNEVEHKILIDDTDNINSCHIRKQIEGSCPDYVIVDYIQLVSGDDSITDGLEEMYYVLNNLIKMARDLDISVIALSQLDRGFLQDDNYYLRTDCFRRLSQADLQDVKLACIHRGEYFRQYEYDTKCERINGLIKYVSFYKSGYDITNLVLNSETTEISIYFPRKKLLYIHGLSSSGMSATAYTLRKLLPEYEVLSPDIPVNPQQAYEMLVYLCKYEHPDIIVGTSMGGMFAQLLRGYKKILINPAFHVSEFMRTIIGRQKFLNPRRDEETHFEITSELCDAYQRLEYRQFEKISDFERKNTYALFGKNDTLVNGFDEYKSFYVNAEWFDGGHRLDNTVIEKVLVPLIKRVCMEDLLTEICKISKKYNEHECASGGYYNIFQVIDMPSNETAVHSAFIADLLNPKGRHRMGDIFLKLFLKMDVFENFDFRTNGAFVFREKYIGEVTEDTGGRIDILVRDSSSKKSIIIENKIYASDQDNQIRRYYNYAINQKYQKLDFKLIYLSLFGDVHDENKTTGNDKHTEKLILGEQYFTLSYEKDILEWLEMCRNEVSGKPMIREAINHYINLIKHLTNQTMNSEMKKELEQLILGNPEYVRNLSTIKKAVELSEIALQKQFWNGLREKMEKKHYTVAEAPKNSNYIIASDDMIENYYTNNRDNHYGFEFKVGDYKNSEILYAVRMHTPIKCGFLARKKNVENTGKRKSECMPITDYSEYDDLMSKFDIPFYEKDRYGWYLACGNLHKIFNFKEMDSETLDNLISLDESLNEIVEMICSDIDAMRDVLNTLHKL